MMVVIGFLRISGFFQWMTSSVLHRIRTPLGLLAVTITLSGVLSAFLINDIVCLTLTPLVVHLARRLRFNPIPHLIGLATAANIGSTGTITGNPQNIYIGFHSGISYVRFVERLLPVAALGLVLNFLVVAFVYRRTLFAHRMGKREGVEKTGDGVVYCISGAQGDPEESEPGHSRGHGWLQRKSMMSTLAVVVFFFTGLPLELIALGGAAALLLGRTKPEKVYREIDWSLLVMFTGLFIVVHAFQVHVVADWGLDGWGWLLQRPVDLLSLVSAGVSNLVSNVPAVLLLEPVMSTMPEASREAAWLALAMSSTFAGNLTVLGSVANLIVVENRQSGGRHRFVLGILQGRGAAHTSDLGPGDRLAPVCPLLRPTERSTWNREQEAILQGRAQSHRAVRGILPWLINVASQHVYVRLPNAGRKARRGQVPCRECRAAIKRRPEPRAPQQGTGVRLGCEKPFLCKDRFNVGAYEQRTGAAHQAPAGRRHGDPGAPRRRTARSPARHAGVVGGVGRAPRPVRRRAVPLRVRDGALPTRCHPAREAG
jgi:Na+/H+ antiporter NhaD/arsenite permease-like protein